MSDPQKQQPGKEDHGHPQIDDPALFLSLDSPRQYHQEVRRRELGSDSGSKNDEEYVPEPIDEEENKAEDNEDYEPESDNFQEFEEEEKEKIEIKIEQQELVEKPLPPAKTLRPAPHEEEHDNKAPKKRKKGKKKDLDSQEDEYSGEYLVRKKGRSKEVKRGAKKGDSTRSRGKPRGRGAHTAKIAEVKRESSYLEDPNSDRAPEKSKVIVKKLEAAPAAQKFASTSFNSSWKVAEEYQQDWDSSNASIWSESVNRRSESLLRQEMMSLIERKPDNIVAEVANLAPLWYSTLT